MSFDYRFQGLIVRCCYQTIQDPKARFMIQKAIHWCLSLKTTFGLLQVDKRSESYKTPCRDSFQYFINSLTPFSEGSLNQPLDVQIIYCNDFVTILRPALNELF